MLHYKSVLDDKGAPFDCKHTLQSIKYYTMLATLYLYCGLLANACSMYCECQPSTNLLARTIAAPSIASRAAKEQKWAQSPAYATYELPMSWRANSTNKYIWQGGYASQYADGVMEKVIRARQSGIAGRFTLPRDIHLQYHGYVAVPNPEDIGREIDVCIKMNNGTYSCDTFLAVDCATRKVIGQQSSWQWMTEQNILIEFDGETAKRLNFVGRSVWVSVRYGSYAVLQQPIAHHTPLGHFGIITR